MSFRCGFIGFLGRPNTGKSTLLNALVGEKIAITTDRPQTTRNIIRGVHTTSDTQYIFVDVPGIYKPRHKLGAMMYKSIYSGLADADLIYYLVDGSRRFGREEEAIIASLDHFKKPVFLILNKIDLLTKKQLLDLLESYAARYQFSELIPISALKQDNLQTLLEVTRRYLPESSPYYPSEQKAELSESFRIRELIREKAVALTMEEVPHAVAVVLDQLSKNRDTYLLDATIVVERDSQKAILIGKNGSMIREIGSAARKDIEALLGGPVFLQLFVRVEKDWRNKPGRLSELGYTELG
ncbi:MAG: GTPase Era [Erysipelotrichaceae bacterium]|jgi:GTP-binding protein Era|nr:GTPase Era [Erysipelotrichaceae bacterium]